MASTRHRNAWDFTGLVLRDRKLLQRALTACDYPFVRIRRRTGKRVPVAVSDLSRFAADGPHVDVHDGDAHGHGLADEVDGRWAALGLYWLPTSEHPAGRVELDVGVMDDEALAHEVFLAEGAHAVQYGALTDDERAQIVAMFEHVHGGPEHAGEFEEAGEQNYWAWRGEVWMSLFISSFAPSLPQPLAARQPWHWTFDDSDVQAVRRMLLGEK